MHGGRTLRSTGGSPITIITSAGGDVCFQQPEHALLACLVQQFEVIPPSDLPPLRVELTGRVPDQCWEHPGSIVRSWVWCVPSRTTTLGWLTALLHWVQSGRTAVAHVKEHGRHTPA